MGCLNKNSSSSLSSSPNSTQAMDWNYYNWCTDYHNTFVIFSAISVVCFLFGFPVNLWIVQHNLQRKKQKGPIPVLSLSVINLTFLAQIPFCLCNFLQWHIRELQIFFLFICSINVNSKPLIAAFICWHRYVAVVHPIVYKTSKKLHVVRKAMIITICFIIVGCGLVEATLTWLSTPFFAIPLIVSLPVIIFCNISVIFTLRKPDPTGKINIYPQKKQALQTIFISFIILFVVYLPTFSISVFGQLMVFSEPELFCGLDCSSLCFSTAVCAIIPYLYLVKVSKLDILMNRCRK